MLKLPGKWMGCFRMATKRIRNSKVPNWKMWRCPVRILGYHRVFMKQWGEGRNRGLSIREAYMYADRKCSQLYPVAKVLTRRI